MSISFNGNQIGYFKCSNGVRQGDPLSPLLFCIVEDVLNRGISNLVHTNQLNLIRAKKYCMVPSHTLFADDIMIFCKGDNKSIKDISNLLNAYGSYSGKFCNTNKSLIYAGGMSEARHNILADSIGFTKAFTPFIYFCVPIFVGRPKAGYFNHFADNIKIKLPNWKAKFLSMTGRVKLVKFNILSMLIHCLSIYHWPGSIVKKI